MIVQNVSGFALGFAIGMIVEWIAIQIYNQIDPKKESNVKLIAVVVMQLVVLFTLMENITDDFYTRMGMQTSQVFVFYYALRRLYPFGSYLKRPPSLMTG